MNHRKLAFTHAFCGALWMAGSGCATNKAPSAAQDQPANYTVALTAATTSSLPKCTSAVAGTVAHVDSPPGLWACASGQWKEIKCTADDVGAVAYANATPALWACVSKQWTQVTLPAGPTGPQGSRGDVGAPGPMGTAGPQGTQGTAGPQGPSGPNGTNGIQGAQGPQGEKGAPGSAGPAGRDGVSMLVTSAAEPAGPNCANGGVKLSFGVDTNGNAALDANEVTNNSYVCNGVSTTTSSQPDAGAPPDAGPPGCSVAFDCGANTECAQRTCLAGTCGLLFAPPGTPSSAQITGDCRSVVCDGVGNAVSEDWDSDVPDDGNPCTIEGCTAGLATVGSALAGTTCNQDGGRLCDGNGTCGVCGDAAIGPSEQCDDHNLANGDGCSATCTIEVGFSCVNGTRSVCSSICGDGLIVGKEGCEDGNTTSGDGCSTICAVEPGYRCSLTFPSVCLLNQFAISPGDVHMTYAVGTGGALSSAPISGTFPVARTGFVTTNNDLCSPLANGDLSGMIALVRRGTCGFYNKAINAQNAGAVAIVVYNNQAGLLEATIAGTPQVTIPFVSISDIDGAAINDLFDSGSSVTLTWLP